MTSRKLVLIRHSRPVIDPAVESREWRLSIEGRRRCTELAETLRSCELLVVVTSDEPKALETGVIVARRLKIPVEMAENLHEHDRRGVAFFPEEGDFSELVARLFRRPDELVFGRETADQAYERFSLAVDGLLARYPTGNLALVSHGTVMTLFLMHRAGVAAVPFWKNLGLPAAVILSVPEYQILKVLNVHADHRD